MKITMIGSGYVGLVTGACFAEWGHQVTCVDKDVHKITRLQQGEIPIYEPGLDVLVATNAERRRLKFTTDLPSAVADADAVFIAVGTPARHNDGDADLTFVYSAAKEVAVAIRGYTVIVTKSTVPVGTGDTVERIVARERPDAEFAVVSNPEFLREGSAIDDFLKPDRVVLGTDDDRAASVMQLIYQVLEETPSRIVVTKRRTAELIKYAANAFLATKITFINEMADLCEAVGADVQDLAVGVGLDHRIGMPFFNAGPGYGGSCFPKDTTALLRTAQDYGVPLRLVEETVGANNARKRRMALKVIEAAGGSIDGLTVAVLGLTFKPDTDDMREAPSIPLIEALQRSGATIRAHDPQGMRHAMSLLSEVAFCGDVYSCCEGADVVVLMTEWETYRHLDFGRLRKAVRVPTLVDLRNIYNRDVAERHGFSLTGIGRAHSTPSMTENPDLEDGRGARRLPLARGAVVSKQAIC
ncbi:UDP-glucose dehydrogenase family protein [Microvirga puerhi]|uniref:UDP-glucose 6-dehydrogenase n=1 Tax=Microvirga puerhi TaxID=2876078 RepID=A0ABS7VVD4_9HYPH|nr:UDP-glucose/GDP-mannose dehydrogenase family protein [Microvirga puerhi]MBZ6079111.1 UDP-glucose/GDP-mannose dehydrogenase family protein [Microvirga puerhi]